MFNMFNKTKTCLESLAPECPFSGVVVSTSTSKKQVGLAEYVQYASMFSDDISKGTQGVHFDSRLPRLGIGLTFGGVIIPNPDYKPVSFRGSKGVGLQYKF